MQPETDQASFSTFRMIGTKISRDRSRKSKLMFCLTQNTLKWPFQCIFGKDKTSILIFSTYPSIFLYQSFGEWKRMSNPSLAMFIGLSNTSKWYFGSESQKLHFFTHFGVPNRALPVPDNGNKCCVCCLKKQQMLPKILDVVKEGLRSLQIFLWHPGTSWALRNLNFSKKVVKNKKPYTGTPLLS